MAHAWAPTARTGVGGFGRQQGLVGKPGKYQHNHEDAEESHGVVKTHILQQLGQNERYANGEETAASGHNAIHQAQALLKVVAQDDQAWLVGKGAATGKHNAVGEVHGTQRSVRKSNKMHHKLNRAQT